MLGHVGGLVDEAAAAAGEGRARAEALLEACSWDLARVKSDLRKDKGGLYQAARLAYPAVPPPTAAAAEEGDGGGMCGGGPAPVAAGLGPCGICGEQMLPPISSAAATDAARAAGGTTFGHDESSGSDALGGRALPCLSGHVYCVTCWTGYHGVQIKDGNGGGWSLRCPGVKCGEVRSLTHTPLP